MFLSTKESLFKKADPQGLDILFLSFFFIGSGYFLSKQRVSMYPHYYETKKNFSKIL